LPAGRDEWGPGLHEDGFGLGADDDVDTPAGFAAWVRERTRLSHPAGTPCPDEPHGSPRWIVEDGRVLGGIVLRHRFDDRVGHIGYGVRPSARRRGLAGWALGEMLREARTALGLDRVLIPCLAGNVASARTIERNGGVLDSIVPGDDGPVRRYWIDLRRAERVRDAYAAVAGRYIELFGAVRQSHPDDLAFIGRHLAGTVLDVGCGPGHLTAHLRSLGVAATGIDPVPEFVAHARAAFPDGDYRLGTMDELTPADGILAWYSLIHVAPGELGGVLSRFRGAVRPGGRLVVGFFDGDEVGAFDHRVITAYRWPADEMSRRLGRAGFTEVARLRRPADGRHRAQAAIAARAVGWRAPAPQAAFTRTSTAGAATAADRPVAARP
jgi:predicted acetyltransferase